MSKKPIKKQVRVNNVRAEHINLVRKSLEDDHSIEDRLTDGFVLRWALARAVNSLRSKPVNN